jgi:hypothetical protein
MIASGFAPRQGLPILLIRIINEGVAYQRLESFIDKEHYRSKILRY